MPSHANGAASAAPLPGHLYNAPTYTKFTEQVDLNTGISTPLSGTGTTPLTSVVSFRQVDVVKYWKWRQFYNNVVVTTGATLNVTSAYAPYNFLGNFRLSANNMYDIIDVQSGIDLAIFNMYRPIRRPDGGTNSAEFTAPRQWPYGSSEVNLSSRPAAANTSVNPPAAFTAPTVATSFLSTLYLPVCINLDEYYDLDFRTGRPVGYGAGVDVTPLNMGVSARDVTPYATYNSVVGTSTDTSPFVETGSGAGFTSANVLHDFRRIGSYAADAASMPPEYAWRYALVSRRFSLSGASSATIPLKQFVNNAGGGQVLSIFMRFFDPSAGAGAGAPIALGSISATAITPTLVRGKLLYGSSLVRFDDDPTAMQQRVYEQHDINLPIGVWLWDMCHTDRGLRSNANCLNMYTTDITLDLTFNTSLSSTAYVVIGTELLTYVEPAPAA